MDVIILLVIEFFFCMFGAVYLFKRDIQYAFFWIALYLYSTPALIGYYFFPALSGSVYAYFGEEYWYNYYIFITLSMICFFICTCFYINRLQRKVYRRKILVKFTWEGKSAPFIPLTIIWGMNIIQIINLGVNFDAIGYQNASSSNFLTAISALCFQISVGYILILYLFLRSKEASKQGIYRYVFTALIISLSVFCAYGFLSGNRHNLLEVVIGILFIEIKLKYFNKKTVIKYVAFMIGILVFFAMIRSTRSGVDFEFGFSLENLLSNDYYAPAHMLFAAMYYQVIEPVRVITTNIGNCILGLHYDVLQMDIMRYMVPWDVDDKSKTYAMYIFTEGYVFMGDFGFLYNGILISTLLYFWKKFASTENTLYSLFLVAMMSAYTIDLVRTQTFAFIKILMIYILPNIFLYSLLVGYKKRKNYR